jgi:hypothetical protein
LRDERPRLGRRANRVTERQLVQCRTLDEIREREQVLDRERPLENDPVQVGDEAAARIEPSVADAEREQLDEDRPDAVTVLCVESFGSAGEWKHADGVPRDDACAVAKNRRDLLPEVVLRVPAFGIECGVGPYHDRCQNISYQLLAICYRSADRS